MYVNLLLGTQCYAINVNVYLQWELKFGIYANDLRHAFISAVIFHAHHWVSMFMYRYPQVRTKEKKRFLITSINNWKNYFLNITQRPVLHPSGHPCVQTETGLKCGSLFLKICSIFWQNLLRHFLNKRWKWYPF